MALVQADASGAPRLSMQTWRWGNLAEHGGKLARLRIYDTAAEGNIVMAYKLWLARLRIYDTAAEGNAHQITSCQNNSSE